MGSIILQKESFTDAAIGARILSLKRHQPFFFFFLVKKINSISTDHNNCAFHYEDRSVQTPNKSAMRKLCNPLSLREIQSQSIFINLRTPFWSLNNQLIRAITN